MNEAKCSSVKEPAPFGSLVKWEKAQVDSVGLGRG